MLRRDSSCAELKKFNHTGRDTARFCSDQAWESDSLVDQAGPCYGEIQVVLNSRNLTTPGLPEALFKLCQTRRRSFRLPGPCSGHGLRARLVCQTRERSAGAASANHVLERSRSLTCDTFGSRTPWASYGAPGSTSRHCFTSVCLLLSVPSSVMNWVVTVTGCVESTANPEPSPETFVSRGGRTASHIHFCRTSP